MFSISRTAARASRSSIYSRRIRKYSKFPGFSQQQLHRVPATSSRSSVTRPFKPPTPLLSQCQTRSFAEKTVADEVIEEIQEQYATARDEFEIATEETEKKSVYAADDRAAAREELDTLKEMFQKAIDGEEGEEVKRRVGQRIRELDHAIIALEESALEE